MFSGCAGVEGDKKYFSDIICLKLCLKRFVTKMQRQKQKYPEVWVQPPLPPIWAQYGLAAPTEMVGQGVPPASGPMEETPPQQVKRPKKPPKRQQQLPQELIAFKNADKEWHESWTPERDLLNFPHPYRAVMCGPPNRGKTTAVKNILVRQWPPFEKMVIIYPGGVQGTSEYEDVLGDDVEILDHFPDTEWWPTVAAGAKKTLCVIDDFELKGLSKIDRGRLDRLVGHVSTHRHVSVILCSQNFYNIPPIARRCANIFVLWKPRDKSSMNSVSQRIGHDLDDLFKLAPGEHDSLWVDLTAKTRAPLRLNGYQLITRQHNSEE